MAPKFFSKILISILVAGLISAVLPAPALAGSRAETSPIKEHTLKFYLAPALVPDVETAKASLVKYVADMNTILAKNTERRLVFDPQTGIILTSTPPHTDSAPSPLPTEGFEIWVNAAHTDKPASFGGYGGMDISGAGVLAGLNWTRIYDPDTLAGSSIQDYCLQVNILLHELAHVFGAGIGEYYNLSYVTDTTGLEPLLGINLNNPGDVFWSDKPDFKTDPLLRITYSAPRAEYLATVRYSNLTAAILNGDFRNGLPSTDRYSVQVLDENDQPLAGANVKAWNVAGVSPNASELLADVLTDENGRVELEWGGTGYSHNTNNFLRLIKVYRDGVSLAQPRYISIFDADAAKVVFGADPYTVTIKPSPAESAPKPQVAVFTSTAAYDGYLLEKGAKTNTGGSRNASATTLRLGDDALNRQYKAILSFDTSGLPDDAIITSVTLKIKQSCKPAGKNPFNTVGNLLVDMRQGAFGNANALALNDFNAAASILKMGVFENSPVDGWHSTGLNAAGMENLDKAGVTQFRLYFARSDKNMRADYLSFFSGNSAGNAPQLLVTYTLP